MSCEHCSASVREEVAGLEGVEEVTVELTSGRLEVQGQRLSDEQIRSAVARAGYELAGSG